MKISSIKNRANQVLMTNKPEFIRILTILVLVGLVPSLFNVAGNTMSRLIYFAISILFLTFHHGYIVSSIKMVRNNAQALNDDDAFVGFKRFKELFPTYLLTSVIIWAVVSVAIFVLTFLVIMLFKSTFTFIDQFVTNAVLTEISVQDLANMILGILAQQPLIILFIFIAFILLIAIIVIVSAFLFAVPYLLEQYQMTTTRAVKESFQMMKSHIWDLIKLQLSFIGWVIIIAIVQSIIAEILIFIPVLGSMISMIVAGLLGIYTYLPQYYLSQAVFFEELAYHRYENNYQYNGDGEKINV